MAHKILVTTDLSRRSRAGLRFAIQLASQQRSQLIFYHVLHPAMPTSFSQERYMRYVDEQVKATQGKLKSFVRQVYRQMGVTAKNPECVVEFKPFADTAIIEYAVSRKVNFICMSTRGAGVIRRILGTNTSSVLSTSPIPVLAVPDDYRRSRISKILYASDLTALSSELKKVKKVADASKSQLSVIHYGQLLEPADLRQNLARIAKRYRASGVKFTEQSYSAEHSISDHLKRAVEKFRPSILAVFTRQEKKLLERIFPQSNSEKLAFNIKRPLLVFPK